MLLYRTNSVLGEHFYALLVTALHLNWSVKGFVMVSGVKRSSQDPCNLYRESSIAWHIHEQQLCRLENNESIEVAATLMA